MTQRSCRRSGRSFQPYANAREMQVFCSPACHRTYWANVYRFTREVARRPGALSEGST